MLVCGRCGIESPEAFRFCPGCGSALAEAPAPRQSRKVVTALFCDVTGSTALGEELDPEVLRGVLNRYFTEIRGIIERHGGTVEKFIGDAVMAVFGIPVVREDDALRAVRAAGEIRERLPAVAEEVGVSLRFRTGVNTGPVLVGEGENLAVGDAVNVAARLEQAAEPGEIVLGEETLALVRDAVEVEPLEPLELKGKSERVPAFRLVSVDPEAAGFARHLDVPLVGRDDELRMLREAWARVAKEQGCHLFTLLGTAGVGKSRLVGEFLAGVAGQANVLRGRCLHYGEGITFWPLVEALMPLGEPAAQVLERLSTGGAATPEELFWEVRRLFEALAEERPVVMYIDDLQWAEPMMLDLLDHVADLSRGKPILLLCTARPELLEERLGWGGGKLNAITVLLEPLPIHESEALLDQLGDGLDGEARARVIAASEGNPLFLEEMVALARERGTVELPPTIQALLSARLERLAAEERELLERGSVEGEVFHRMAVKAMAGERLAAEVEVRLAGLVRKELIRPHPATFKDDEAFRFRHLLIRDAAYDALPKEARADLHERFARWLEGHAADLLELDEIAGWHLEQAVRYRRELGRAVEPQLASGATKHLQAAARRAAGRSDVRAAVNLFERALALVGEDDPIRFQVAVELADQLGHAGDFTRAEALVSAAEHDPVVGPVAVLTRLEWMIHTQPDQALTEARGRLPQLLDRVTQSGDERGIAKAHMVAFYQHLFALRGELAAEEARLVAVHAGNAGHEGLRSQALGWYITELLWGPAGAERIAQEVDEVARGHPGPHVESYIDLGRGEICRLDGAFPEALELTERAAEKLAGLGMPAMAATLALHVALVEISAGQPAGAIEALSRSDATLAELEERGFRSTTQAFLAWVYSLVPDHDAALAACDLAEELSAPEDVINFAVVPRARARLAVAEGDTEGAERLARTAVRWAMQTDCVILQAAAKQELAEVLSTRGRLKDAETEARAALQLYEQRGDRPGAARMREFLEAL